MSCNINDFTNKKNAKFEVEATDLLSFCDCLSLIRNKIGLVAWGDEDFLTLFGEGTTCFYTANEKSITSAIESLKLKIKNTKVVLDYVFFIVVCSDDQLDSAYSALESMSQYMPNCSFWFQIFPIREASVVGHNTLTDKKLFDVSEDSIIKDNNITLYLLTNKR